MQRLQGLALQHLGRAKRRRFPQAHHATFPTERDALSSVTEAASRLPNRPFPGPSPVRRFQVLLYLVL
jgi:hypothetical protein